MFVCLLSFVVCGVACCFVVVALFCLSLSFVVVLCWLLFVVIAASCLLFVVGTCNVVYCGSLLMTVCCCLSWFVVPRCSWSLLFVCWFSRVCRSALL